MAIQSTASATSAFAASSHKKTAASVKSDETAAGAKVNADIAARKLLLAKQLTSKATFEFATERQAAATGKVPGESLLGTRFTGKA